MNSVAQRSTQRPELPQRAFPSAPGRRSGIRRRSGGRSAAAAAAAKTPTVASGIGNNGDSRGAFSYRQRHSQKVKTQTGQRGLREGDVTSPNFDGRLTAKRGLRHNVDYLPTLFGTATVNHGRPDFEGEGRKEGRGGAVTTTTGRSALRSADKDLAFSCLEM